MFEVVQFDMKTIFMKSYIQCDILVYSLNQGPNQNYFVSRLLFHINCNAFVENLLICL